MKKIVMFSVNGKSRGTFSVTGVASTRCGDIARCCHLGAHSKSWVGDIRNTSLCWLKTAGPRPTTTRATCLSSRLSDAANAQDSCDYWLIVVARDRTQFRRDQMSSYGNPCWRLIEIFAVKVATGRNCNNIDVHHVHYTLMLRKCFTSSKELHGREILLC